MEMKRTRFSKIKPLPDNFADPAGTTWIMSKIATHSLKTPSPCVGKGLAECIIYIYINNIQASVSLDDLPKINISHWLRLPKNMDF